MALAKGLPVLYEVLAAENDPETGLSFMLFFFN